MKHKESYSFHYGSRPFYKVFSILTFWLNGRCLKSEKSSKQYQWCYVDEEYAYFTQINI